MNRQLESAWKDLISYTTSFRFVGLAFETQSGHVFLPLERVLEKFLLLHPQHASRRAKLLDRLRGSDLIAYGNVRIARSSRLGAALAT
jgi:hypothetical protein